MRTSQLSGVFLKLAKRLLGVVLMGIFGYFVYRTLSNRLSQSSSTVLAPSAGALALTAVSFSLWLMLFQVSWEWVFRKICSPSNHPAWPKTGFAFYRSLLARYIPGGKMWYLAARTEVLAKLNVPRSDTARSVFYEQIHYSGASAILATALLPFFLMLTPANTFRLPVLVIGLGIALVGVTLWLFWPVQLFDKVNAVFTKVFPKWKPQPLVLRGRMYHWQFAFGLFFLLAVCQGVIIYPIAASVLSPSTALSIPKWILVLGAYPVARMAGQLSVVAPGGVGVREGAYLLMTLPILGGDVSSVIVIWARILSIVTEILMFSVFGVLNLFTRFNGVKITDDKVAR